MQDRRKLPRKDLMSYSQVFDLVQGKLIGYLGDLNLIGRSKEDHRSCD
jgi:hypothetical protein